jgi:hypothetical protein
MQLKIQNYNREQTGVDLCIFAPRNSDIHPHQSKERGYWRAVVAK